MQNCFESNANDKLEWKTVQLEGRYGITMEYWINTMVWLVTQSPTFWSKVKGALRSTTASKASRCDEIPAELFKSLKDYATLRCCIHYVSKSGNPAVATGLEKVKPHPSSQEG